MRSESVPNRNRPAAQDGETSIEPRLTGLIYVLRLSLCLRLALLSVGFLLAASVPACGYDGHSSTYDSFNTAVGSGVRTSPTVIEKPGHVQGTTEIRVAPCAEPEDGVVR